VANLTKGIPQEFGEMLEYARNLNFTEEPNYNTVRKLMKQALSREGIVLTGEDLFCWEVGKEGKIN
jgi:hypothetical protein